MAARFGQDRAAAAAEAKSRAPTGKGRCTDRKNDCWETRRRNTRSWQGVGDDGAGTRAHRPIRCHALG